MEIDLSQPGARLELPAVLRAPVCIIGAGIAGLILAHQLAAQGIDLILLEAGSRLPSTDFPLDLSGDPYAGATQDRIRVFGGTSLLWGGQLLPPLIPASGRSSTLSSPPGRDHLAVPSGGETCIPVDPAATAWPFAAGELAPYVAAAERLLRVDTFPYEAPEFFAATRQPTPALLAQLPGLIPRLSKFIPFAHRNLAHTIGNALRSHPRVQILLHARVRELLLSPERNRIEAALVDARDGSTLRVEDAHFVVAAGTLESVRLLLASCSTAPEGLGNTHGQLGRNLHDHLTLPAATLHGPARDLLVRQLRPWIFAGTVHSLKLETSPRLCRDLNLNPAMAHLTFEEPADSGVDLLRRTLRARQGREAAPASGTILRRLPSATLDVLHLLADARLQHRRYISPAGTVRLQINSAQRKPARSRLTLSDRRDAFGQPLAALDWHVSPEDLGSIHRFATHLRGSLTPLAPTGIGWLPVLDAPDPAELAAHLGDARHPMGGAILSPSPRTGVVAPDLTVHGIPNLSVASGAIFPDGTVQLPTLLLAALTLRLARGLTAELRR